MAIGAVGPYNAAESQVTIKTITTLADVGAGNIAVIYGSNIGEYRQLEIRQCIKQCIEALIEEGFIKPAAGTYRVATLVITGGKSNVIVTEELSTDVPVAANVAVAYSDSFDNAPHSTLNFKVTASKLADALLKLGLNTS